jgi:hypothetical protein
LAFRREGSWLARGGAVRHESHRVPARKTVKKASK